MLTLAATEDLGTMTVVTEEMALSMTQQARDDAEAGAKWLFAGWYVYVSMIWSLKGIMLAFFSRLPYAPDGHKISSHQG